MAGPWLKNEWSPPDKPHMLAITAAMGWDDPDLAFAKLFRLWRWFDQHTVDGNAAGVTPAVLDRVIGVTGFVQAVANVGWLEIAPEGISLSRFGEHNGDTAKNRAQTAKRVAEHKSNAKANGEGNADTVTKSVPRGRGRDNSSSLRSEEGKRKRSPPSPAYPAPDDVDPQVWADWLQLRKAKSAPVTATVVDSARSEAVKAGMTLEAFLRVWCARGSQGLQAEWLKPHERASPIGPNGAHGGFKAINYREGVSDDGSFA